MEEVFSEFGLTRNETKIYLTLLKVGSALAGDITERTGIHRRNVYDSIERLQEKGLISYVVVDNKKWFNPANPKRFLDIIEEKKHQLDKRKAAFEKVMPNLNITGSMVEKHGVSFFKGAEGIKTVFEDLLSTGEDYLGYGHGEGVQKILKSYFDHYTQRRKKLNIKPRLIFSEKNRNKSFVKKPLTKVRFLSDKYSSYAATRIYGNNVALLLFAEDEPMAILIKNKKIADSYRQYFEIMWNAAKS
jgi:sugar-specific transcriptional regulator TrmB